MQLAVAVEVAVACVQTCYCVEDDEGRFQNDTSNER